MNAVDVLLVVLGLLSIIRGLRLGAAVQVLSFGGFWAGLLGGAALAPSVVTLVHGTTARVVVSLVIVFGLASLVGGLGRQVGVRLWGAIRRVRLGAFDSAAGAAVAVAATMLASWVVASMLLGGPWASVTNAIQGSRVLKGIDGLLPPAPSVFSRIQGLLDTHGFPQVFAQLAPQSVAPVQPPSNAVVAAAVHAAEASTVKIEGQGCGELLEGSGFVWAPGLVVTNAHVIAGTSHTVVIDQNGTHPATPVFFDPHYDLAVLRTGPLAGPVLPLDDQSVPRGTTGAVLGYPGGGGFDSEPAAVAQQFDAVGRDIYGSGLTTRSVYQVDSLIRPGNSGGPLVEPDGTVIGVVFSRSSTDPNVGYALASPGVVNELKGVSASSAPVGTGACAG